MNWKGPNQCSRQIILKTNTHCPFKTWVRSHSMIQSHRSQVQPLKKETQLIKSQPSEWIIKVLKMTLRKFPPLTKRWEDEVQLRSDMAIKTSPNYKKKHS